MNTGVTKLMESLPTSDVAVVVSKPENRRYLSGFTGTAGTLLVCKTDAYLITDGRYGEQACEQAPGWTVIVDKNTIHALTQLVRDESVRTVWFDARSTTYDFHGALQAALATDDVQLVPRHDLIEDLRQTKTVAELRHIDKAFEMTNAAFEYIFGELHVGLTEHEVGWMLEKQMREAGAEKIKENHVIASGPRSALPHGRATSRVLQKGDFLTMDIGAVVNGYYADMTRTVVFGEPDARQREVYELVQAAQLIALDLMRPGLVCGHADDEIRNFFRNHGVADNFAHTLGHALGLEIHEQPALRGGDETILQAGHVITVEPGLYFPGWGGVRIEDPVVITADGYRNLATVTKELVVL